MNRFDQDPDGAPHDGEDRLRGDLPTKGVVEDFFAAAHNDIEPLPADDLRFQRIQRGAAPARRGARRASLAVAAAAALALGGLGLWHQTRPADVIDAAEQSATTVPVPSPSDSSTAPTVSTPTGPLPVPVSFDIASFTTGSETVQGALGSADCGDQTCTSVVRSRDAGKTWQAASALKDVTVAPNGSFATVPRQVSTMRFADAKRGWIAGSTVLVTNNGGQSWTNYPYPGGTVVAMEVDENQVRFVTAQECSASVCSGPVRVYQAAVGAKLADSMVLQIDATDLTDVELVTDRSGAYLMTRERGATPRLHHLTVDGSSEVTSPCERGSLTIAAPADQSKELLAACAVPDGPDHVLVTMAQSSDSGENWSGSDVGPTRVEGTRVRLTASSPEKLAIATVGAQQNRVWRSADGGGSWEPAKVPPAAHLWVAAGGGDRVFAFSGGGSYQVSEDGAVTWREVSFR
ncbi:WD40/YVTN/BNR-like repeat-containing protein [Janibacter sp. GXQ6167]|uniref:WD40/YVTN/BNR-like repeat-containing protein n=1 Tax=Janibacter sp. GXQ6167 TaxID=3240791 RepID=UPI003526A139